jgi:internalin A
MTNKNLGEKVNNFPFKSALIILLFVLLAAFVLFFLSLNFNNPLSQAPTATSKNNNVPTLNPKVTCARFTNLAAALTYINQACILDLSNKNLSELPQDITKLKNLIQINLSKNNLTVFPNELLSMDKLIVINLSNNKIAQVPTAINKLKNLQGLDLSNNQLTTLPDTLSSIKTLRFLNVKGNNIDKTQLDKINSLIEESGPQSTPSGIPTEAKQPIN